jgi:hypothetical protein
MKGVFYNSKKAVCSIHESGKMCFEVLCLSNNYSLDYSENTSIDDSYDFIIFNEHFRVNNWMNSVMVRNFKGAVFCIVTEITFGDNPIAKSPPYFDYYIVLDPTIEDTDKYFGFPRPIQQFPNLPEYTEKPIPVIGSFGFSTEGKLWHKIIEGVQDEFDQAIVRFNIPQGTYTGGSGLSIEDITARCNEVITKKGIKFKITSNDMTREEIINWCSYNTLNCFFYDRTGKSVTSGLAAVTDQAIASKRPLLVSEEVTFRHVLKYMKSYKNMSFKEAIETTGPIVEKMREDWSHKNFVNKFEKILNKKLDKIIKISYAICVCNESKDLYSLISFLKKVKDAEDEINILVDSAHVSPQVRSVLEYFKEDIVQNDKAFDGKFASHRNHHFKLCKGDYIFYIDPDEMPNEILIKNIKNVTCDTQADLILIPRVNICPGYTEEWLSKTGLQVNENGWLNWPDMQGRIFKNNSLIKMENDLHERIVGAEKVIQLQPSPQIALWHIKSVEKQNNRWDLETKKYISPIENNLYDSLM